MDFKIEIRGGEGAIRTLEGEAPTDLQSASFSHLVTSPEKRLILTFKPEPKEDFRFAKLFFDLSLFFS
jgi:hypothetical protein